MGRIRQSKWFRKLQVYKHFVYLKLVCLTKNFHVKVKVEVTILNFQSKYIFSI